MEPCAAAPFGSRTILNALRVALGILNRFICRKRLSAEEQQTALFPLHSCNLCNYDNFS